MTSQSPSKRVVELLELDLRNCMSEIDTLNLSIKELEAKRDAAYIKLNLFKRAVGGETIQTEIPLNTPIQVEALQIPPSRAGESVIDSTLSQGGFRESIRGVLAEKNRGMKPRDVYRELQSRGVPYTGKVDPVTRTHNELYRMAKIGQIKKRGSLYYALRTTEEQRTN